MSIKTINTIDLVTASLIAFIGGGIYGYLSATEYYKTLFKTSRTSDDPDEAEKASKTLCRRLGLDTEHPSDN